MMRVKTVVKPVFARSECLLFANRKKKAKTGRPTTGRLLSGRCEDLGIDDAVRRGMVRNE